MHERYVKDIQISLRFLPYLKSRHQIEVRFSSETQPNPVSGLREESLRRPLPELVYIGNSELWLNG